MFTRASIFFSLEAVERFFPAETVRRGRRAQETTARASTMIRRIEKLEITLARGRLCLMYANKCL